MMESGESVERRIVEVLLRHPSDAKKNRLLTGCVIAPDRILTAGHAFGGWEGTIELRWPCAEKESNPLPEEVRDVLPETASVKWPGDEKLDATVLECTIPDLLNDWVSIASDIPPTDSRWRSMGFPKVGERVQTCRAIGFTGTTASEAGAEDTIQLDASVSLEELKELQGISGAPVFVGDRLVGIVQSYMEGLVTTRFDAVPTAHLLNDSDFIASIGIDPDYRDKAESRLSDFVNRPPVTPTQEQPDSARRTHARQPTETTALDNSYVVFFRLADLHSERLRKNKHVAGAFMVLKQQVETSVSNVAGAWHRSAVTGRFAVVPGDVNVALQIAAEVVNGAAADGVELNAGVAFGRVEERRDVDGANWAGKSVNLAARLAAVPEKTPQMQRQPTRRVLVDEDVIKDATAASDHKFGVVFETQVKRTSLRCGELKLGKRTRRGKMPVSRGVFEETSNVIVFDIVRYSELELQDQITKAEELNRCVSHVIDAVSPGTLGTDYWYSPAGDGGAIVIRDVLKMWAFAKVLRTQTVGRVSIRIGISVGPVVMMDDGCPVGAGIHQADELSGVPEDDRICCSLRFWKQVEDGGGTGGWSATTAPGTDIDARLLSDSKSDPSPDRKKQLATYRDQIARALRLIRNSAHLQEICQQLELEAAPEPAATADRIAEKLTGERGTDLDGDFGKLFGLRSDWEQLNRDESVQGLDGVLDWLLPVRFADDAVDRINRQIQDSGQVLVTGTATDLGFEIVMARLDGQHARIQNRPTVDLKLLPPDDPRKDTLLILQDVAHQLRLEAHPVTGDRESRIKDYSADLEQEFKSRLLTEKRVYYCFVKIKDPESDLDAHHEQLRVLREIDRLVKRLVFVTLDKAAQSRREENRIASLLRTRGSRIRQHSSETSHDNR